MPNFVQGVCEDFCPEAEYKLRTREKLLNFFEYKDGQKHVPGTLVKCFARSAAGIKTPKAKDMRTERCLQRCIEYLLKDIILDKRKPFNLVYDFIFDRLRAIRQEMVMQNYNAKQTIKLLQPMIMFLSYSRYKLCEEAVDNFDPKICEQHLQECLKRALVCYDEISLDDLKLIDIYNRAFLEALYQIFNLGSVDALKRCLTLPKEIRTHSLFSLVFKISLSYLQGNYYRVLTGLQTLPHILCAIGCLKLPTLRRNLYEIFANAYSSKQLSVPVDFVLRLTAHANVNELREDCKYYNIKILDDKLHLNFQKNDFNSKITILKCKHEYFVDEKLKNIYLPEVLLMKKM
ncbi:SAC3 domain-containing protein 1 isoform X1 [Lucilia sericata]|uniref:SAC3 domain-containing protein 1 isoform X1 n=2 Tax=Lucilia sericata TaxID=13632 RepID=UPI0018A85E51|nr:SAC3 domain-containing protein 1 isoform X1 [Lucilia sericata]